ncbi:MAG: apolipoprotein N-acyltransferase [Chromatiales bacterium]|nr:MAG: apolipoprotein N-acyltransferase [Chromatiales bacterium]
MRSPAIFNRANGLAAVAGALLPLGFAPFGAWWLVPFLLAALFALWDGQTPRDAAMRGLAFGIAAFAGGTYWTYISVHGFAGTPAWLAVLLSAALVLASAAHVAAAGWLAGLCRVPDALRYGFCWPAAYVATEWIRGWIFTGFPWLSLGYGQIDGPLSAWAPVLGIYGVSLLVAVTGGLLLILLRGTRRERAAGLAAAVALAAGTWALAGRDWTSPAGSPVSAALVQGSITQDRKWLPEQRLPTMALYRDLTLALPDADLVVWPEVAVPSSADRVEDYLRDLKAAAEERGTQILLGIIVNDFERDRFHNSLLSVGAATGVYHKRHLVPFGEFFPVPDFVRQWMRMMDLPYRDVAPGSDDQPPLIAGDVRLAPSICYEDAFGAEQLDFLPESGLLVNVSNDAWFGDSIAAHQHLEMARMRSLETGRAMLRSTNTGITALIDADGTVMDRLPQFETGVLKGQIQPRSGSTPFVRAGNVPVVLLALLGLWLGIAATRRPAARP